LDVVRHAETKDPEGRIQGKESLNPGYEQGEPERREGSREQRP
jgi:hypothetical protein